MIFGGLEIVAGGYLLHRHYRKKNKKDTAENDDGKKHHTFPGAHCAKQQNQYQHHARQPQAPHYYHHHQPATPLTHQKHACYAIAPQPRPQIYTPQTLPQPDIQPQPQPHQHRPQAPQHTQSFNIPRRPVPERKPQIIIQPTLQRTDSFATLSRMPVANGSRPHDVPEQASTPAVYSSAGYSLSTPAFGATPTSPGLRYEMATAEHAIDGGWEGSGSGDEARPHYAPTVSTQLGEREVAPPPYVP